MKMHHLNSLERLETANDDWDCLWNRTALAFPSTQVQPLAQWMGHFAGDRSFHALGVESNGTWQAALPLVEKRWSRILRIAELPGNEWSPVGNLLLDSEADGSAAIAALIKELSRVPWTLLRLEPIRLDAPQWRLLLDAFGEQNYPTQIDQLFDVGQVTTDGDWDAYLASRSRNLRKDLGKAWRRLEKLGTPTVKLHFEPNDQQLADLMRRGFTVEDRGWKGREGTSVLKTPRLLDYYVAQAAALRDRGQLQLSLLEIEGDPIAFEYGWRSHATYFSFKVGYDEAYQRNSPGQLLRMKLLEHFFADDAIRTVDFFGPINGALAAWATETFPIARIVVGRPTFVGRTLVDAYRRMSTLARRWRKSGTSEPLALRPYEKQADCRSVLALTESE